LELGEEIVEPIETGVPGVLEGTHPVVQGFQGRAVDSVPATTAVDPDRHQVDSPQHA
jgi:hypothetical protein